MQVKLKLLFFIIFNGLMCLVYSQALPQHINYQAILRNQLGEEIPPNTSAVISFSIYNTLTDPNTSPAYVETHAVVIPVTKVVSLKIGSGNQVGSGTFNTIAWSTGNVNYLVGIDNQAIGSRQVFSSVPYALYSLNSGQTYSPSSNITLSGNVIDLSSTGVQANIYGSNSGSVSTWPTFSVNSFGRLTSANTFSANVHGDIRGRLDSQYVAKIRNMPISANIPTAGQVYQFNGGVWEPANMPSGAQTTTLQQGAGISLLGSAPNYTVSAIPTNINAINGLTVTGVAPNYSIMPVTTASLGVWSTLGNSGTNTNNYIGTSDNANLPFRTNNTIRMLITGLSGNVGINQPNPGFKLDVVATNGLAAIHGNNNSGSSASAHGVYGLSNNVSNLAAGVFGLNTGSGSGVLGKTSSNSAAAILGENLSTTANAASHGVLGISNNLDFNSAGVFGQNKGNGIGVLGTASSNTAAILGANTNSTNAQNAHGVYGVTFSSDALARGVYGENKGAGHGVFGFNSSVAATNVAGVYGAVVNQGFTMNAGVLGESTGESIGVLGKNSDKGVAVKGIQSGGAGSPTSFAGEFQIVSQTNPADAILASTNGPGAAVHARNGVSPNSALSLLLDGGHIQSVGPLANTSSVAAQDGFSNLSVTCNGCTDVKGKVNAVVAAATVLSGSGLFRVQVSFAKPYVNTPHVVITAANNPGPLTYFVSAVNTNMFQVTFVNNTLSPLSGLSSNYNFNYIVIE